MSKHIFWIASYPKSGNTLIRAIISSLFFSEGGEFDFNMLKNIPIIEDTANLEFIKNTNLNDYNNLDRLDTLSKYWIKMQSKKNLGFNGDFLFAKTHHALIKLFENPFTIQNNTRGIIYIVRDPRDVVLSMCNHFRFSIKKSINSLLNNNFSLRWQDSNSLYSKRKKPISFLSSWENHFLSWNENSFDSPRLVIKYEDMVYNKRKVIKKLIYFFNKNYNFNFSNLEKKLENIIEQTSFDNLKKKEKESGFQESVNDQFFNVGEKNQWVEKLSKEDIYLIEKNCFQLMQKLDYSLKFYNKL